MPSSVSADHQQDNGEDDDNEDYCAYDSTVSICLKKGAISDQ